MFDHEPDAFLASEAWLTETTREEIPPAPSPSGSLARLADVFSLAPADIDLCLLALAPELNAGYGRVFAYLQDDIARQRASGHLALDILADGLVDRMALRTRLTAAAPLLHNHILALPAGRASYALDDPLLLDEAVLAFLLTERAPKATVSGQALRLNDLILDDATRAAARRAAAPDTLVVICGPAGSGRGTLAAALAAEMGMRLSSRTLHAHDAASGASLSRWFRDLSLAGAAPALEVVHATSDVVDSAAAALAARLHGGDFPLGFLLTEASGPPAVNEVRIVEIAPPSPRVGARREAWRRGLASERLTAASADIDAVAAVFPLNIPQILRAAREAGARARLDGGTHASSAHLNGAARSQSRHRLDRLADRVPTVHAWEDLVLPGDRITQLHEVASAVRRRRQVLETWAFGDKVSVTPGVSVLFFGPSGTGKTMSAGILAADLGMELYRVDLSRLVSKFIGETEKNLDALFEEAQRAHAVLLFDEADAIFGKRSEVKDAHDRYANIEVAFLLQRMESYEGITILTTNLRKNIDQAFLRRIQFAVEFPRPTVTDRLAIWKNVWPPAAELEDDIDFSFLARHFEWPGGNIRNIALKAAYLAAEDGAAIGMRHLIASTRREFQKLGRLCVENDFGEYGYLLSKVPAA